MLADGRRSVVQWDVYEADAQLPRQLEERAPHASATAVKQPRNAVCSRRIVTWRLDL